MGLAAWMRGLLFAAVCLMPIACGAKAEKNKETKAPAEPEPEVKIEDIIVGTGPAVEKGDWAEVHYTGTFLDGTKFGNSVEQQDPIDIRIGRGQMIPGFDKGMMGMKVGGKRRITIPPALGYGSQPKRDPRTGEVTIPANSTLIFEIDLLKVSK